MNSGRSSLAIKTPNHRTTNTIIGVYQVYVRDTSRCTSHRRWSVSWNHRRCSFEEGWEGRHDSLTPNLMVIHRLASTIDPFMSLSAAVLEQMLDCRLRWSVGVPKAMHYELSWDFVKSLGLFNQESTTVELSSVKPVLSFHERTESHGLSDQWSITGQLYY